MDFRIADTFTDSLSRLTGEEQKTIKTTAFDLQLNPANPGFSFHKLDKAKDKNFWSVRVNNDIRLIVHRTPGSLLLCYVDHHDKAYDWAGRRKLETHPKTGAAQFVEIREKVQEIVVLKYVEAPKPAKPSRTLFSKVPVPLPVRPVIMQTCRKSMTPIVISCMSHALARPISAGNQRRVGIGALGRFEGLAPGPWNK